VLVTEGRTDPWLVVGLGNPGPKYAETPHNVGWHVIDVLARRCGVRLGAAKRAKASVAQARLAGVPVVLVKPADYMNNSGGPTKALLTYYGITHDRLVVVHDELDLPAHALRLKFGGGDNGHNGLRSLRSSLGSGDFFRVRIGVGRPPGRQDPAEYLLRPAPAAVRSELPTTVERAADAVETLIARGLAEAQNTYNS
jgi:PTH1 family peptidyl-tRNA hydrolase